MSAEHSMLTQMWLYQWLFVFSYTRATQLYKSTEFRPDASLSLQTVKVTTSVRSKLECMTLCTSEPSCTAVRYLNSGTKMCYFLDRANSIVSQQSGLNYVVYQVTKGKQRSFKNLNTFKYPSSCDTDLIILLG